MKHMKSEHVTLQVSSSPLFFKDLFQKEYRDPKTRGNNIMLCCHHTGFLRDRVLKLAICFAEILKAGLCAIAPSYAFRPERKEPSSRA